MSDVSRAEAKKRVETALEQIELAQTLLAHACREIGGVIGVGEQYTEIAGMHDRLKELWQEMSVARQDVDLDSIAKQQFKERT